MTLRTLVGLGAALSLTSAAAGAQQAGSTSKATPTSKVSVRVAPADARTNAKTVAAFDLYFESAEQDLKEVQSADDLSVSQCGHLDDEWMSRFKARNQPALAANNWIAPGTRVVLPPCPFWTLGGSISINDGETVSGALLRQVGQSGPKTLKRVASFNHRPVESLDQVKTGDTINVPWIAATVPHTVRPKYLSNVAFVISTLNKRLGTSATPTATLTLVGEDAVECDNTAGSFSPFDPERVADVLERNRQVHPPDRKALVGIIDTGIDAADASRLFVSKTIGANMDRRQTGPPTTAATYKQRAHGTHVAGLTLGGLSSARLTAAVRDRIELRIINIVTRDSVAGPNGPVEEFSIPVPNLSEAIAYARRDPVIPILNLSVETDDYRDDLLNILKEGDYLAVVAAGNDHRNIDREPVYPAGFRIDLPRRFITVAAHKPDGELAAFSNRGRESVDLAAPGCRVQSTLPGGGVGEMTGTSQAAPLVTFAVALLYSEGLDLQDVRNRIRASVKFESDSLRMSTMFGGSLDIERALSLHDDVVSVAGQTEPLKGTLQVECLPIGDEACVPLDRLARLVATYDKAHTPQGMAWRFSDRGDLLPTPTNMPSGVVQFTRYGSTIAEPVKWDDIRDIVFARRQD